MDRISHLMLNDLTYVRGCVYSFRFFTRSSPNTRTMLMNQ